VKWFEFTDPDKTVKFTVMYLFRIEGIGNQNIIPVIRSIPVTHQHFDFIGRQSAVLNAVFILSVSQIIFILPPRKEVGLNKVVSQTVERILPDFVHRQTE